MSQGRSEGWWGYMTVGLMPKSHQKAERTAGPPSDRLLPAGVTRWLPHPHKASPPSVIATLTCLASFDSARCHEFLIRAIKPNIYLYPSLLGGWVEMYRSAVCVDIRLIHSWFLSRGAVNLSRFNVYLTERRRCIITIGFFALWNLSFQWPFELTFHTETWFEYEACRTFTPCWELLEKCKSSLRVINWTLLMRRPLFHAREWALVGDCTRRRSHSLCPCSIASNQNAKRCEGEQSPQRPDEKIVFQSQNENCSDR